MQRTFERQYFYFLDRDGVLYHDNTALTDSRFLNFFFKYLRPNTTGLFEEEYPFISPCGREMNFLKPEDTPIVFQRLEDGKLFYAPGLSVPFVPENLRFSRQGILYHPAPVGQWGRIAARIVQQWMEDLTEWGPWYALRWQHRWVVIQPREADERFQFIPPRPQSVCAACGPQNPANLGMHFLWDRQLQAVRSWFTPDERLQGHPGWVHGGYIALLHDEVMGKLLSFRYGPAATVTLQIHFYRPLKIGVQYEIQAQQLRREGKTFFLQSVIRAANAPDPTLSTAEGQFQLLRTPGEEKPQG